MSLDKIISMKPKTLAISFCVALLHSIVSTHAQMKSLHFLDREFAYDRSMDRLKQSSNMQTMWKKWLQELHLLTVFSNRIRVVSKAMAVWLSCISVRLFSSIEKRFMQIKWQKSFCFSGFMYPNDKDIAMKFTLPSEEQWALEEYKMFAYLDAINSTVCGKLINFFLILKLFVVWKKYFRNAKYDLEH